MIRQTKAITVSQIFSNDKRRFYQIPKYQREYTWGITEWDLLFNDILDNDEGYFLGSIICVDSSKGAMDEDTVVQIIDGQQRITSLSLLILALHDKLSAVKDGLTQNQIMELYKISNELALWDEQERYKTPRIFLQVQNNNKADYESLLAQKGIIDNVDKPKNAGKRRIYKGFNYFSKILEKYIEEIKAEDPEQNEIFLLFKILKKVNNAVVVSIEVETNKDAYMLFESLNNRGIPLSAIDLIKNSIISQADSEGGERCVDDCYEQWKSTLSYLTDDYSVQERFFRQYYNTYRELLNKPYISSDQKVMYPLGYLATKSTMLGIYEYLIKDDYKLLLSNLKSEARYYSILINNAKDDDQIPALIKPLRNLERIQGAPSYILLLYLLSNQEKLNLTDNMLANIIRYLISYFVRRNITDYPNTRNLNKIFMDSVAIASQYKGLDVLTNLFSFLKQNSSQDAVFEDKLRGSLYLSNVDATRFILCFMEEKYSTKEIYTDLWEKDEHNKFIWTIEHIFPEGENIPQCWVDMIAGGNKELASEYLNKYAHTLGNLTITGYNSNLSNMSFEEKKNRSKGNNYIGYRNGLNLNDDVVSETNWTIEKIADRTDKFVKQLLEDFKL